MHDSHENISLVFLYGLVKSEFNILCDELQQSRSLIALPTFIPTCLLELKAEDVDKSLHFCHKEIQQVKVQTGITRSSPMVDVSDFDKFDFVAISRVLTTLSATLANCELACDEHLMLLNHLNKANNKFMSIFLEEQRDSIEKSMKALEKRIDFVRCWTQTFGPGTK